MRMPAASEDLHGAANMPWNRTSDLHGLCRWRKWFADAQRQPCAGSARRSPTAAQFRIKTRLEITDIAFVLHPSFVFPPSGREQLSCTHAFVCRRQHGLCQRWLPPTLTTRAS